MATTLTLISADPAWCARLVPLINESPSFHCVGVYASAAQWCAHCRNSPSDLLLLDVDWREAGWPVEVNRLCLAHAETAVVVVAPDENPERLVAAMAQGACGYVLRHEPPPSLLGKLEQLARGLSPVSAAVARQLIQRVQGQTMASRHLARLSSREKEILEYLALGYPYKQIADQLAISINTVRTYVRRLYAKLEVPCRAHAVLKCQPAPWGAVPPLRAGPAPNTFSALPQRCDLPNERKVV
ncbi:MAG: response regulator transcription factor [Verrucomicrobiae bacterium]|nr:response regulator transcription factor [Verrucomicrobiae bacterium]